MIAGGILMYQILIVRYGWKMNPPRVEYWATCLGAVGALAWFLYRNGYFKALRVAGYSAFGPGFGFAFGNFLQTLASASGIVFRYWNLMEFTLGFFGGLGMAYAVFTREWPESAAPSKPANWVGLLFLLFTIPGVNIIMSFIHVARRVGTAVIASFPYPQMGIAWTIVMIFLIFAGINAYLRFGNKEKNVNFFASFFLSSYTITYILFCNIKKIVFYSGEEKRLEQYACWILLFGIFLIWFFHRKIVPEKLFILSKSESWKRWLFLVGMFFIIAVFFTVLMINTNSTLPRIRTRF